MKRKIQVVIDGHSNTPKPVNPSLPLRIWRIMSFPSRENSRWGTTLAPIFYVNILGDSKRVSHTLGPSAPFFLARLGPHTPNEHRASTSEESCYYLYNLFVKALEEELSNLVYYTCWASAVLAIGGSICWDVLLSYQHHNEMQILTRKSVTWCFSETCTCYRCKRLMFLLLG